MYAFLGFQHFSFQPAKSITFVEACQFPFQSTHTHGQMSRHGRRVSVFRDGNRQVLRALLRLRSFPGTTREDPGKLLGFLNLPLVEALLFNQPVGSLQRGESWINQRIPSIGSVSF